jgi:hypothetical protein
MSNSRISFVHVVKGTAKEKLYLCVFVCVRARAPFSALGVTKEDVERGICEGPLVLKVKLKVSFYCFKCVTVPRKDGNAVLFWYLKVII